MIEIRLLAELNPDDLRRLATGYTSPAKYRVSKTESDQQVTFTLELVPLQQPYIKHYDHLDSETLERYRQVPQFGFSLGAYDQGPCVGIVLAEPHHWNKSLWVREIHVAETHRRRGVGRQLMEELAQRSHAAGLRTLVCETQNLPANCFYQWASWKGRSLVLFE
jgi:GNAT superfamily N-acetyltransferase